MDSGLTATSLQTNSAFNWIFLVESLVLCVLTVFFLFYFNRLFATLVSYAIRAYTWHQYQVYIDIQALQISLLAGRIFFKDIRYHGHNQTILVHGGHITWQYWIRKVRGTDVFASEGTPRSDDNGDSTTVSSDDRESTQASHDKEEKGGVESSTLLPCRISIKVSGLEAFLYNRSPVYDSILANIAKRQAQQSGSEKHAVDGQASARGIDEKVGEELNTGGVAEAEKPDGLNLDHSLDLPERRPASPPSFLQLFPIHVDCTKGAIVLGNENTTSIMTVQFEKASGDFDATRSGPLDSYQQQFNFDINNPVIHMRANHDFKAYQLATASTLKAEAAGGNDALPKKDNSKPSRTSRWQLIKETFITRNRSENSVNLPSKATARNVAAKGGLPLLPGQEKWQGLSRYLDESRKDEHDEWGSVEYARTSQIVDCPKIRMLFYWDVPGPVSHTNAALESKLQSNDDINGNVPPAYGLKLHVFGGVISYGPWADRQRINLQNVFFPGTFVDAVPAERLTRGQYRVFSIFKILVTVEEDVILRIPMKESSKDWKWKDKAQDLTRQDGGDKYKSKVRSRKLPGLGKRREKGLGATVRPFGWLDIKVVSNSTISYNMDMFAREDGYHNALGVDVKGLEISTSVNHGLLWKSGQVDISGDLSNPLGWNVLRQWKFDIVCDDLDLFILRDHLFLLTDLIGDWGSGPPPQYFTFVPVQYALNVHFKNFKIYLNTNDSNIINNPTELDENCFIVLFGEMLHGKVTIPLDRYRPLQNEIPFDVCGKHLGLDFCLPPQNTLHSLMTSKHVARLENLTMRGSHSYYTETSSELTDRLHFDIHGSQFSLVLFGFLIHHLMKVKENYFGEDLHFKTLEEYQDNLSQHLAADAPGDNNEHHNKSNHLDVVLCITAEDCNALLPSKIYSAAEGVRIDVPYASADLRFTNYYMDLEVNFSPLSASLGAIPVDPDTPIESPGPTQVFIASADIVGHRVFGLPPTEPTYVCSWDFAVGAISGECSSSFLRAVVGGAQGFAYTLDDDENALPIANPVVIHDVTYLQLRTETINLWLHVLDDAIMLSSQPISLDFNDLAGPTFSQRLQLLIPKITFACIDGVSASRQHLQEGHLKKPKTYAFVDFRISLCMLRRKFAFNEDKRLQQSHIREHDQRTNRAGFLLTNNALEDSAVKHTALQPPALVFPPLPVPVAHRIESSQNSLATHNRSFASHSAPPSQKLRSKASRSSLASSLARNRRPKRSGHVASETTIAYRSDYNTLQDANSQSSSSREESRRPFHTSSIALTSPLATPLFPLQHVQPDLSDVDELPDIVGEDPEPSSRAEDPNDDSFMLDETFVHTSYIIDTGPGVRIYLTPNAIKCVANVLDNIFPKEPEDVLDTLHISTMTEIMDNSRRQAGTGKSNEMSLGIARLQLRVSNPFPNSKDSLSPMRKDMYDINLDKFKLALRSKASPTEERTDTPQTSLAIHTTFRSVDASIKEDDGVHKPETCVTAHVSDFLVWLSQKTGTRLHILWRGMELSTASYKIAFLAALIHRTTKIVETAEAQVKAIVGASDQRTRYLVHYLSKIGVDAPDPTYLSRASYVGRVGPEHLRNQDSWKISSRLRCILLALNEQKLGELRTGCLQAVPLCPDGAQADVFALWDQWRTWDLRSARSSLLMRNVYQIKAEEDTVQPVERMPFSLTLRSDVIRLTLDPGPKRSETSAHLLFIAIDVVPPPLPSGLHLVKTDAVEVTAEITAGDLSARINWEVCELVDATMKMHGDSYSSSATRSDALVVGPPSAAIAVETPKDPHEKLKVQVVFSAKSGTIELDCVHVKPVFKGQRMHLSVAANINNRSKGLGIFTVLAHAEKSGIDLSSRSRIMMSAHAKAPSIFLSRRALQETPEEWKVVGACSEAAVDIAEEILGLIDLADAILMGEVAYIQRLVHSMTPKRPLGRSAVSKQQYTLPNLTVALLMDAYNFEIAVLPSLRYSINGSIGRASVSPSFGDGIRLNFDLDLDANEHRLYDMTTGNRSDAISTFEFPPVSLHFTVQDAQSRSDRRTVLDMIGTVELVQLEASALHGLMNIVNTPEISKLAQAVQDDVEVLQNHALRIFPKATEASSAVQQKPDDHSLLFRCNVSMAGLRVVATAPTRYGSSSKADLVFRIGSTQVRIWNLSTEGTVLALPELTASFRHIGLDLDLTRRQHQHKCGNLDFGVAVHVTSQDRTSPDARRIIRASSSSLDLNIYADTASAVVDVVNHLQDRLKDIDLSMEKEYLRSLRQTKSKRLLKTPTTPTQDEVDALTASGLFTSTYLLELHSIHISWIVGHSAISFADRMPEDLVLSFKKIELSTKTEDTARLMIEAMQLQMVPPTFGRHKRSLNSALLPEMVFNVVYTSSKHDRRLAFHAAGKSLDLQLESKFVLPAKSLEQSITLAVKQFHEASANWKSVPTSSGGERKNPFDNKRLSSLLIDADFAGAVVNLRAASYVDTEETYLPPGTQKGRYGQFAPDNSKGSTSLRAPGVALKIEYRDDGQDSFLNAELKVDASSNALYPSVVPLIVDISNSIKDVVKDKNDEAGAVERSTDSIKPVAQKLMEEDSIIIADPSALLGKTRLHFGFRICKQEFGLSCQPIARVSATARFDDIYMTMSSVKTQEHGHFIAIAGAFDNIQASVQHVYSKESTFSFRADSVHLSLMNSKHLSGKAGLSAILKINPTRTQINARQLQDFLLFREIWIPPEVRQQASQAKPPEPAPDSDDYLVQRYQQVATAAAFPWNATIAIADLVVDVDFGQSIGKSSLKISNMWGSSRKDSDWEQNLCIGIDGVQVDITGRMNGDIELSGVKVRTSIRWPTAEDFNRKTPFIQASAGFGRLIGKIGFDYQVFAAADISDFEFLMYNVKQNRAQDRLVAILDGDKVQVCLTSTSAAQVVALHQAFQRLVQENQTAYLQSLRDVERFLRRKSSVAPRSAPQVPSPSKPRSASDKAPISLGTDVVVTLKKLSVGAFPNTLTDHQVLSLEGSDAQARFAAALRQAGSDDVLVHSALGLTLGRLSVALASVSQHNDSKQDSLSDITAESVLANTRSARGGTILRVPKVLATMQTWQAPQSKRIEYQFKSSFEGKVDVGWNYSRIASIRNMWASHERALASRLGKPLPESAVKITGVPSEAPKSVTDKNQAGKGEDTDSAGSHQQTRITAVVNVPQSTYEYFPLGQVVIDTPQLRDMGEATPPLEWIGLHRERLPNVTHQIVIVPLLGVAKEVEDAYTRILGSS